ncbi:MAG: VanZ family protein, partial [Microbacteriaceae bacterium]|nr:VanZ family protein [Burkholderiaceae bacterium]
MSRHRLTLAAWLAWTAFVVYGSLLPFDFRPTPLEHAWALFREAPFLALGIESRADWIANAVLYVPVGFLTAAVLLRAVGPAASAAALGLAALWCAALAGGVEFVQLFFPPRTVSLNDLMAETIGSGLGIALSPYLLPWMRRLQLSWDRGGLRRVSMLLPAYVLAYPALCLFPYDLLLSGAEFRAKLSSDNWGWWLAGGGPRPVLAALQLALEVGLALPFGWLLARRRTAPSVGLPALALAGGLLGLGIEAGQFMIASGISQGASVLSRSAGVLLGALLWREGHRYSLQQLAHHVRCRALPILLVHGLLLAVVTGWFVRPWQGLDPAQAQWQALRLMPFYYHYYTTEALALFSLGSVVVMYLPVAVLGWSLRWSTATAAVVAGLMGLAMEGSKLFLGGTHPDPTNALIAAASAATVLHGLAWLDGLPAPTERPDRPAPQAAMPTPRVDGAPATEAVAAADAVAGQSAGWRRAAALRVAPALALALALALAAWSAQRLPLFALPVLLLLLVCAGVVWQRPVLALALVPAALPVLDLAPWTGRFYWDEFDLLCLVCWAVAMFRSPPPASRSARWDGLTLAFAALALSLLIGTVRGGWPWQWPDENSFIGYYGGYNALRIVKGAVVAGCFVSLFRRLAPLANERQRMVSAGINSGLALAVAVILWERNAFVGWLDFATDYRVTGPFSAMHKGGAYIECYLAVASAFAATTALQARDWLTRLTSAGLLLGAAYALTVTYSRNGYAAFALMLVLVLGLGALRTPPAGRALASTRRPSWTVAAVLL